METATFDNLTTWHLANLADCGSPDRPDRYGFAPDGIAGQTFDPSPGARFLRSVADSVAEAIDYAGEDFDPDDFDAHELADGAVPVYTHDIWEAFTDLAAYNEDPSEYGASDGDLTRMASVALYMIGERLAVALAREWAEAREEVDA